MNLRKLVLLVVWWWFVGGLLVVCVYFHGLMLRKFKFGNFCYVDGDILILFF